MIAVGMARALLALGAASAIGAASPAAGAQAEAATAPTGLEAWYTITPVGGTGLPPLSRYPEGTLHVGVSLGNEDARTYLTLDLTGLPEDSEITGGELRLPVDPDPANGTTGLDAAGIEACLVPDPGEEAAAGESGPPPALDCSLREPATLVDGAFVVDLDRFARVLDEGGIALLPNDASRAALATWHVTLHGRNSQSPNAEPISATLELATDGDDDAGEAPPPTTPATTPIGPATVPPPTTFSSGGEFAGPVAFDTPAPTVPAAVVPPPAAGDVVGAPLVPLPTTTASTGLVEDGFAYGIVFALPLVLLAFGGYFANALTRPAVVDRSRLII